MRGELNRGASAFNESQRFVCVIVGADIQLGDLTMTSHVIRPAVPADQPVLWEILYEALWDPPGAPRRPRAVLENPFIAAYVKDWGSQASDLGFLSTAPDGSIAGGILSRLMLPPLEGGAFYDAETPQLGIAVFPDFRNQGIGSSLFEHYLAAASKRFPRVALGVHPENQTAIRLYKKFGFAQFATGKGGYLNMVRDLSGAGLSKQPGGQALPTP